MDLRPPPSAGTAALVVELCGLPGAGKTTLAGELVARLTTAGCAALVVDRPVSAATARPRRLTRKAAMLAAAVGAAPLQAGREARLLARGQEHARDRLAAPAQWLLARRLTGLAGRGTGVRVLEEGLVQAWWTAALLSRGHLDGPTLARLAAHGPRPDLVVHLDVPLDLALDRLDRRASRHSRVQQQDPAERRASLQRGDVLLRELLAAWAGSGASPVLLLDAAGPDIAGSLLGQLPPYARS